MAAVRRPVPRVAPDANEMVAGSRPTSSARCTEYSWKAPLFEREEFAQNQTYTAIS
jgi:hypothetical protein